MDTYMYRTCSTHCKLIWQHRTARQQMKPHMQSVSLAEQLHRWGRTMERTDGEVQRDGHRFSWAPPTFTLANLCHREAASSCSHQIPALDSVQFCHSHGWSLNTWKQIWLQLVWICKHHWLPDVYVCHSLCSCRQRRVVGRWSRFGLENILILYQYARLAIILDLDVGHKCCLFLFCKGLN